MPRGGPRRKAAGSAGPRCTLGRFSSPTGLTTRALLPGMIEDGGKREGEGDGPSSTSMSSEGRALRSKDQERQQKNQELGREKAYSSMAKYFLRFSRRQG